MSMDINKLPSNSNATKNKPQVPVRPTDSQQVKKVVKGKVTTKKNEVRKFTDVFVAEDVRNVRDYVVNDIAVPTIKNLIVDLIQNSVEMLILGGKRGSGRGASYNHNVTYRDYNSYSRDDRRYASSGNTSRRFDYDDIVFSTAADADAVLDQLYFMIRKYGLARVSDLYDMCDITAPYTAHNYGWTNLDRARVVPTRGGYIIELPRAAQID